MGKQRKYTEKEWTGEKVLEEHHHRNRKEWRAPRVRFLQALIPPEKNLICDVGCSTGRGAFVFPSQNYIGVDINVHAIKEAKRIHPEHSFQTIIWGGDLPPADVYLFVNVLLHISDDEIRNVLSPCVENRKARVLIVESMCSCQRWRSTWHPRDVKDYDAIFRKQRYSKIAYARNRASEFPYFEDFCLYEPRG